MDKQKLGELLTYFDTKMIDRKPSTAVHYCSISTFERIIEPYIKGETLQRRDDDDHEEYDAKMVRFFASDIDYMNDKEEYEIGKRIVSRLMGGEEYSDNEESFLACFCEDLDNLTQWKYYGKDCGLAVEFDIDDVVLNYCDKCKCSKNEYYPQRHDIAFMPYKVCYVKGDDDDDFSAIVSMLPAGNELSAISLNTARTGVIPYIKHKAFSDERESRIVLYHCQCGNKFCSSTKYRVGAVLKPYLELRMMYGSKKAKDSIPIRRVTVGPGYNQDEVFNSVCRILERSNMRVQIEAGAKSYSTTDGIDVVKSEIPFRS